MTKKASVLRFLTLAMAATAAARPLCCCGKAGGLPLDAQPPRLRAAALDSAEPLPLPPLPPPMISRSVARKPDERMVGLAISGGMPLETGFDDFRAGVAGTAAAAAATACSTAASAAALAAAPAARGPRPSACGARLSAARAASDQARPALASCG